jgi:hypothetical protein
MQTYVVRQGETVASIVARNGGGDPDAVWNHSKNAELRKLRGDPAILCPGDRLYLPDGKPSWLPVTVGSTNTFKATVPVQTVKIVLVGDKPLAGEPYIIHGLGDDISGTTDGSGSLSVDVPITAPSFALELTGLKVVQQILVGHLDPVDEASGVRQRLANLGYASRLAPILEAFGVASHGLDEQQLRIFQITNGLSPTGEADDATVDALKNAHGV